MTALRTYIREVLETQDAPVLQPNAQIFCDMDGVIADFVAGIIPIVNDMLAGGEPPYSEATKGHRKRLRKAQREVGPDFRARTKNDINIRSIRSLMLSTIGAAPWSGVREPTTALADGVGQLWPFHKLYGSRRQHSNCGGESASRRGLDV